MPLVYHTIKAYKRRTTKASAAVPLDTQLLLRDFGRDIVVGQAVLFNRASGSSSQHTAQGEPSVLPPNKRLRADEEYPMVFSKAGGPTLVPPKTELPQTGDTKEARRKLYQKLKSELFEVARTSACSFVQEWIDSKFKVNDLHRQVMGQLVKEVCRNCIANNKGLQEHSLKRCRELGNKCALPCKKCTKAGRYQDIYHWTADCPHK